MIMLSITLPLIKVLAVLARVMARWRCLLGLSTTRQSEQ